MHIGTAGMYMSPQTLQGFSIPSQTRVIDIKDRDGNEWPRDSRYGRDNQALGLITPTSSLYSASCSMDSHLMLAKWALDTTD